jgi:predicted TIM-barrel fold metal-dependent hydrolase
MDLVVSIHIGGRQPFGKAHGPGAGGIIIGLLRIEMADPLLRLIWGGAPVRFPRLRWALVESGIGWIGSVLGVMDHWWNDHRGWLDPKLPEKPSHYFHRQFFATFENDRAGVLTRELLGPSNLMWGSDYPHTEGVWPFSRRLVSENFEGVDETDTRRMVHDNAVALYGFPSS